VRQDKNLTNYGRPRFNGGSSTSINVYLTSEVFERVQKKAAERHVSLSKIIRDAVDLAIADGLL